MLLVSAHQPAYIPWLGYFHKILVSDKFVIMDDVQFEKNSFINRNTIIQNGSPVMLSIPVATKNYKDKTIREMSVADSRWQAKHLRSIRQSYAKAPFFDQIFPHIERILTTSNDFLVEFTEHFLNFCIDYIGIKTEIIQASTLNIQTKKLDYVIELTKKVGGDAFLFGAQGKTYVDLDRMKAQGVSSFFQSYVSPKYEQLSKNFIENVSILDLLFNEPAEKIVEIILNGNASKEDFLNV